MPDDSVECLGINAVFLTEIETLGSRFPPGCVMRWFWNRGKVHLQVFVKQRQLGIEEDQRREGGKGPSGLGRIKRVCHRRNPGVMHTQLFDTVVGY